MAFLSSSKQAAHTQQLLTSLSAGLIAGIRTILGSASMVVLVMPNSLPGGIAPALDGFGDRSYQARQPAQRARQSR